MEVENFNLLTENNTYSLLKRFTLYLWEQRLTDAPAVYLHYLKEADSPLLSPYSHLSQDTQLEIIKKQLSTFLKEVLDGTAVEACKTFVRDWVNGKCLHAYPPQPSGSDLIAYYSHKKQLYLHFLPDYAADMATGVKIIQELEELIVKLQSCAVEIHTAVQMEKENFAKEFSQLLIRNSAEGVVAYDKEGKITLWNKAMESICNISAEEAIGKDVYTIYKNFINEEEAKALDLVWHGKRTTLLNLPYTVRKGFYNIDLVPIVFHGEIIGGANFIQDITALREAEVALDRERSFLHAILDNMEEWVIACNEKGELAYFNKAARMLYEVDQLDIPSSQWASFYRLYKPGSNEELSEEELPLLRALRGEHLHNLPFTTYGANGVKIEVFANGQQILSNDGKVIGALIVMHDVTARLAAERQLQQQNQSLLEAYEELRKTKWALEESNASLEVKVAERTRALQEITQQVQQREQQLNLVINAVPALISYVDADYRYRFVNDAYLSWFGVSRNEIIGKKTSEFLEGKVQTNVSVNHYKALQGESLKTQLSFLNKDGEWIDTEIRYIPHIAEGIVLGFIVLAIDQTESIKARTELAEKNKELTVINADLDNFIYTASHDLKAPILNLEGLFTALHKRLAPKYGSTEVLISQMINDSIEKFKTTIKHLTEITKAQKDIELQKEMISFIDVIDDVLMDIRPLVMEADPDLNVDLQVKQIFFAPKNLRSIVYNLLSNAIKYRAENRALKIDLRTYREGDYIVLEVQDNGLGIEAKQLPKLFNMFKRLHTHVEGTGVGLYIIKRIIENTGGRIEVASQLDQGTTFRAYLHNPLHLHK